MKKNKLVQIIAAAVFVNFMSSAAAHQSPTQSGVNLSAKKLNIAATPSTVAVGKVRATLGSNTTSVVIEQEPVCIEGDDEICSVEAPGGSGGGSGGGGGFIGGGGEGGGAGGGSTPGGGAVPGDGSTGTNMTFNRSEAACLKESLPMAEVAAQTPDAAKAAPLGEYVPLIIGDPLYDNGDWEKWQYTRIQHSATSTQTLVFRQTIHYMVNRATGEIAQIKLKNSAQYGCQGIPQA